MGESNKGELEFEFGGIAGLRKYGRMYVGENRADMMSAEKWEVQGSSRRKDIKKGKTSAEKKGEIGETPRGIRGIKRRDRNEKVFARPNGLRENAETAVLCTAGDLDLPGRRKRCEYTSSREEEDLDRCTDVPVWQSDRE